MDSTQTMSIAQMASAFGVSHRSLRFYESKELLAPRRIGTERRYQETDAIRLEFILKGKRLGFSLEDMRRMILEKGMPPDRANADVTALLSPDEIEGRLAPLRAERRRIEGVIGELEDALRRASEVA